MKGMKKGSVKRKNAMGTGGSGTKRKNTMGSNSGKGKKKGY